MRGWQDYNLPDSFFAPVQRAAVGILKAIYDRLNVCETIAYGGGSYVIPDDDYMIFEPGASWYSPMRIYEEFYNGFYGGSDFLSWLALAHGWTYTDDPLASYEPQLTALLGEPWVDWETPFLSAVWDGYLLDIVPTAKILEQTCRIVDSLQTAVWWDGTTMRSADISAEVAFLL